MKKVTISQINEMKLTDIKTVIGNETCCIWAKVRFPDVKAINLTYDCTTQNLIIHEWWRLDEDALNAVSKEICKRIEAVSKMSA